MSVAVRQRVFRLGLTLGRVDGDDDRVVKCDPLRRLYVKAARLDVERLVSAHVGAAVSVIDQHVLADVRHRVGRPRLAYAEARKAAALGRQRVHFIIVDDPLLQLQHIVQFAEILVYRQRVAEHRERILGHAEVHPDHAAAAQMYLVLGGLVHLNAARAHGEHIDGLVALDLRLGHARRVRRTDIGRRCVLIPVDRLVYLAIGDVLIDRDVADRDVVGQFSFERMLLAVSGHDQLEHVLDLARRRRIVPNAVPLAPSLGMIRPDLDRVVRRRGHDGRGEIKRRALARLDDGARRVEGVGAERIAALHRHILRRVRVAHLVRNFKPEKGQKVCDIQPVDLERRRIERVGEVFAALVCGDEPHRLVRAERVQQVGERIVRRNVRLHPLYRRFKTGRAAAYALGRTAAGRRVVGHQDIDDRCHPAFFFG